MDLASKMHCHRCTMGPSKCFGQVARAEAGVSLVPEVGSLTLTRVCLFAQSLILKVS